MYMWSENQKKCISAVSPYVYAHQNDIRSYSFYRATLCVSAVFAVARCPSVCLSVTLVYCIQTAEDIVKLFPR